MAYLTKRVLARPLALALVVGLLAGLGFLGAEQRPHSAHAQVADPSRARVILDWYAARNRGDDASAGALFADNAFFISAGGSGTCPIQAPCYDRASALQSIIAARAANPSDCFTVTSIQVAGRIVTGRLEVRSDTRRARGIERTVVAFMADVTDSQIVLFVQRGDNGDPLTALNAAIGAGTAQPVAPPIPTPDSPCG